MVKNMALFEGKIVLIKGNNILIDMIVKGWNFILFLFLCLEMNNCTFHHLLYYFPI